MGLYQSESELLVEYSFNDLQIKGAENMMNTIRKDVNNANPTTKDKIGRWLTKNTTVITLGAIVGTLGTAGASPVLIPIGFIGSTLGVITADVIMSAVMKGYDPFDATYFYRSELNRQIVVARKYKADNNGDKAAQKRADDLIKEINKILAKMDKDIDAAKKKKAVKESIGTPEGVGLIFKETVLR